MRWNCLSHLVQSAAPKTHPSAQAALQLMNVNTAQELAGVCAGGGLARNMAALRARSTGGIQRGHMALYARNIAIVAGATGADIDRIAQAIVATGDITADAAKTILNGSWIGSGFHKSRGTRRFNPHSSCLADRCADWRTAHGSASVR